MEFDAFLRSRSAQQYFRQPTSSLPDSPVRLFPRLSLLDQYLTAPSPRCFTALSEKVSQTSALEDRRLRRDLQETFIRLSDAAIQLAGRAAESGTWVRKTAADGTVLAGLSCPLLFSSHDSVDPSFAQTRPARCLRRRREMDSRQSRTSTSEQVGRSASWSARCVPPLLLSALTDLFFSSQIVDFLAQRVLADLRRFLVDADKTAAVCSNMVYYIVAPAFKTRAK